MAIFLPIVIVGKLISTALAIDQRIVIDCLISFYNVPFAILGLYFFRSILYSTRYLTSKGNIMHAIIILLYWVLEIFRHRFFRNYPSGISAWSNKFLVVKKKLKMETCIILASSSCDDKISIYPSASHLFHLCNLERNRRNKYKRQALDSLIFVFFLLSTSTFTASMNYMRFGSILESGYGSQASSFSWGFFLETGLIIFFPCKEDFTLQSHLLISSRLVLLPAKRKS